MPITTQDEANASIAAGCGQIQDGIAWYEANQSTAEIVTLHGVLGRLAARAEEIAGVTSGTFSNPHPDDGGGPKS